MSLALGYSSGEDEDPAVLAKDAFGLSALPATKKPRVEELASHVFAEAAPHVLSEVSLVMSPCISTNDNRAGSAQSNITGNKTNRHPDECQYTVQ